MGQECDMPDALTLSDDVSTPDAAVIGVFDSRVDAEAAVDTLQNAGFAKDRIGYVIRGSDDTDEAGVLCDPNEARAGQNAASGMLAGGITGGVLATLVAVLLPGVGTVTAIASGLLSAFFSGTVAGMAVGGIIGALRGLGISDEQARVYEQQFHEGKAIVAVKAGARSAEAAQILSGHRGYQVHREEHPQVATDGNFPTH
jgi:hypothetical protein